MRGLGIYIFDEPGGVMLADWTYRGDGGEFSTNEHGFSAYSKFTPMSLRDAFEFYDMIPRAYLVISNGVEVAWEGRVEDRAIVPGGLEITALGYWRAFTDVPATLFGGRTGTEGFRSASNDELPAGSFGTIVSNRYEMDNNNRLWIGPRKNESYSANTYGYLIGYIAPHSVNVGAIQVVQFSWEFKGPNTSWVARAQAFTEDFTGSATLGTIFTSTAGTTSGIVFQTATSATYTWIGLFMIYSTGGLTQYTGETGDTYFKITNLRAGYDANQIVSTTCASSISPGAQAVTPASMENIRVGMQLAIGTNAGTDGEMVTVTAVTATTFAATFVKSHTAPWDIKGIYVHTDELVKDVLLFARSINPQLSSVEGQIEAPGVDLTDEIYEDVYPADILTSLTSRGDSQTPPRRWEVGVYENRQLHFRPRGSGGQTWYTDADSFELQGSLEGLVSSAYAVYQDANGRVLRTSLGSNPASVATYGHRRQAVPADTTYLTRAETVRDMAIADGQEPPPRFGLTLSRLYTAEGARVPLWKCRAGDVLVIRNLPLTYSQEVDKIRRFVVAATDYDLQNDVLTPTPDPDLAADLAVMLGNVAPRSGVVENTTRATRGRQHAF